MRISDDRYSREQQRLDLALRFLRHEARTQSIRKWTGLTDDRIRKLYRSYLEHAPRFASRHRGKSPQQITYFTRSLRHKQETAVLASLLSLLGVVPAERADEQELQSLARGTLLCEAYEAYRALLPSSQISFEHAIFLVTALARGDLLRLDVCRECGSLMVVERLPVRDPRCQHCLSGAR
jgi:hypothetical protein